MRTTAASATATGLRPAFFAACISTGISKASAATLFMTADKAAARPDMMLICVGSLRDCVDHVARHHLDGAGIGQAAADDQDQRNDDRRRMAETRERLFLRHEAGQQREQQRDEGNQVVAPAPPDQEHKNKQQQSKSRI